MPEPMNDDGPRRPSIATIFNPKKTRSVPPAVPRPSVVVTDEDTPGPPLQLTNGGGSKRTPMVLPGSGHRGSASSMGNPSVHVTSPHSGDNQGEFILIFLFDS